MNKSKAFTKWLARVKDTKTAWTESEVIYFRKAIGICGLKDQEERLILKMEFEERASNKGYSILPEHNEKGRNYLLSKSLKKNGQVRKGSKLGARELDIMLNLKHHKLTALYPQCNGFGQALGYLPVYTAYDRKGNHFQYIGATYEMMQIVG